MTRQLLTGLVLSLTVAATHVVLAYPPRRL
jgi:hypothetical protein